MDWFQVPPTLLGDVNSDEAIGKGWMGKWAGFHWAKMGQDSPHGGQGREQGSRGHVQKRSVSTMPGRGLVRYRWRSGDLGHRWGALGGGLGSGTSSGSLHCLSLNNCFQNFTFYCHCFCCLCTHLSYLLSNSHIGLFSHQHSITVKIKIIIHI